MIRIIVIGILIAFFFGFTVFFVSSEELCEDNWVSILGGVLSFFSAIIVELYTYYSFNSKNLDIFKAHGIGFYFFIFFCVLALLILILATSINEIKYFMILIIFSLIAAWLFSPIIMNKIERYEIIKEIESQDYKEEPFEVTIKIGDAEKTYYLYESPQLNNSINEEESELIEN